MEIQLNTPYLLSQIDIKERNHLSVDNFDLVSSVTSELAKLEVAAEVKKVAI